MNARQIIITLVLFPVTAMAQTWTLQQCLNHAAEHNITVQKNRLNEQDAIEQLKQKQAALFPSLSFSMSQSLGYKPFQESSTMAVQNGMATTTNNKVTENGSYGLNANWTVWDGGINRKNIEAQRVQSEMTAVQTEQSLKSIQEQIAQLYVQILYTTEAKKVNEQLAATAQQQLDRGQERFKVGDLAKADVAADEMDDSRALSPVPDKQSVYNQALETRPEIRAAELQVKSADVQLDIAKRGYLPTVSLNAGIGDSHYSASDDSYGEQLKRNLNGSIGLGVSVPIFDNRRNKTTVNRAKISQTAAALDLQDKRTTLGSTIENLWLNATSAQQRFISANAAVKSQETTYELTNEQFKAGLKNIVDLLQARDNLLQAQQNKLQSKYTTILNTQLLKFYEGGEIGI